MESGKLRRRVVLQTKTASKSSTGAVTYTWATLATVWARVSPLGARELMSNRAELQQVTTSITIRYRDDVTPEMRATWAGHTYDIESVIPDERLTMLTLLCTEAV